MASRDGGEAPADWHAAAPAAIAKPRCAAGDLSELQAELRHFAAERHWQPFHMPRNLTTVLMVEAAELAQILQWMAPEGCVHDEVRDAAVHEFRRALEQGIDAGRQARLKSCNLVRCHDNFQWPMATWRQFAVNFSLLQAEISALDVIRS